LSGYFVRRALLAVCLFAVVAVSLVVSSYPFTSSPSSKAVPNPYLNQTPTKLAPPKALQPHQLVQPPFFIFRYQSSLSQSGLPSDSNFSYTEMTDTLPDYARILTTPEQDLWVYSPVNMTDQKIVCIVFDDGLKDHFTTAVPILQQFGFKATFAVVTSFTESDNPQYMNWGDIATLQSMGMDIESHSYSHHPLTTLDNAHLQQEIVYSKQMLANHGIYSDIFVYPFGDGPKNSAVRNVVAENYLCARGTYQLSVNTTSADRYDLGAKEVYNTVTMEDFARKVETAPLLPILYYHGVGDGFVSVQQFEEQMQYLADHGFTVMTLKDAFLTT
jgi:peptidoglycan/xylan/chitin deacetylase (PgdA/CDA1 family)